MSFVVKKSRFGVKLNSKRWETDRQFHILRGASCRDVTSSLVVVVWLMSINGKMKRRIGFGTIIAKTRGAYVIARVNLWAESKMGLKQKTEEDL